MHRFSYLLVLASPQHFPYVFNNDFCINDDLLFLFLHSCHMCHDLVVVVGLAFYFLSMIYVQFDIGQALCV